VFLELAKMIEAIFKNQVLMTVLIASIWIVPGVFFASFTNLKYKKRIKEKQIRKISKLYPQS
tara:strand:+ start:456 stop:641 length:186 start_codon:yes stop_codon:yes gene_type:complete